MVKDKGMFGVKAGLGKALETDAHIGPCADWEQDFYRLCAPHENVDSKKLPATGFAPPAL